MAFSWSRSNPARNVLAAVDDSAFREPNDWAAVWRTEYRAARTAGVNVRGRVRLSPDLASRIYGARVVEATDLHKVTTLSFEFDAIEVWIDKLLPAATATLD